MTYRNSIYNTGNDYPQTLFRPVSPVPPGPVPPGPTPPGPTPPGPTEDPINSVSITLASNNITLKLNVSGDQSTLDYYEIRVYSAGKLVKTFNNGKSTTFALADIDKAVDVGDYTVSGVAVSIYGNKSPESEAMEYTVFLAPAAMTLRFEFSDLSYDPIEAGVGTAGTWAKLDSTPRNIWDWTNTNPNWESSFKGAFIDENNAVSIIAAGDTSGVTSIQAMFAGIYTSNPGSAGYSLTSRNNVTYCIPFDVSSVTRAGNMFHGTTLQEVVKFKFNGSTVNQMYSNSFVHDFNELELNATTCYGLFSMCFNLVHVGKIKFNPAILAMTSSQQFALFHNRSENGILNIESIDGIEGCGTAVNFTNGFSTNLRKLKRIGGFIDCTSATATTSMFQSCETLEYLPELKNLGNANITSTYLMFRNCYEIKEVPLFDTSHVTDARYMMDGCRSIKKIPDYDFSSVTDVARLCKDCRNVSEGIFETYEKLLARGEAITDHTDCFLNCGIDTPEGRAQLYQIPQDWGGLKPDISITFKFHDTSYNPAEHQLGVGKAVTGEDKYEQNTKKFSAEWVCLDQTQNIWLWCVTEGTNLSSAFVYGDGTGVGVPMLSGKDYITGIPEELTLVEGGTRESLMRDADTWKYGTIDQADWVPEFEIIDWDLENATDITAIIGTNVWFKNNLIGTLPALRSTSISNIGYAFDRCWNVTSMGPINLPNCSQGANNAFMSMMGLTSIPEIEAYHSTSQLNNTFNGCLHASKKSIEDAYATLSEGSHSGTHNCFKNCGTLVDTHSLDNIPKSWGGNATIIGTNVDGNISPLAVGGKIIRF